MNATPDKARQMTLFDGRSLNVTAPLKEAMRQALADSGLSREQVVDGMNELCRVHGVHFTGRAKQISLDMLEKWTANSADHVLPLKYLPLFCRATASDLPMRAVAAPLNLNVIDGDETRLLQWARMERQRRALLKEQRRLEGELG